MDSPLRVLLVGLASVSVNFFSFSLCSPVAHLITVLPELRSLPTQFHRYITPSIRRVFVEPEAFKQRLDALATRNAALEQENRVLVAAVAKEKKHLQEARKQLKVTGKKTARACDSNRCVCRIGPSNLLICCDLDLSCLLRSAQDSMLILRHP
ncbi:hypothetical protein EDD85DRAFT_829577 [Armillaria nabsnona]|nr:hypothetical protein EDD85DRAFT_829577 [Armillaria nabsnona]